MSNLKPKFMKKEMFIGWRLFFRYLFHALQGIIFLVSHRNLLCIFYMTAIQNIFCVAVFFHRSVQNFIWNIYPSAEIANQIWGGKLFPALFSFSFLFPVGNLWLHRVISHGLWHEERRVPGETRRKKGTAVADQPDVDRGFLGSQTAGAPRAGQFLRPYRPPLPERYLHQHRGKQKTRKNLFHNPLKTSPEYTRAGVYGKCML